MITFLVSGLWHGADWTYVIWGGIHGLYQVVGDLTKGIRKKINAALNVNTEAESYKVGQVVGTFILTTFAWIFFRADSMAQLTFFLKRMVTRVNPWALFDGNLYNFGLDRVDVHTLFISLTVMVVVDIIRVKKKEDIGQFLIRQNLVFRWIALLLLILGTIVYGAYGVDFDSTQFIYFNF